MRTGVLLINLGSPNSTDVSDVRDYLRDEVMPSNKGRSGFMARVAANALDIVDRELALDQLLDGAGGHGGGQSA